MFVVALICVAAGTWQISRFRQSVHDNDALIGNAHAAAVPLSTALVPLVNQGPAPGRAAIRFRTVTASGSYLAGGQQLVRNQAPDGTSGFYVLDPFRTSAGVLLVVRGFVADKGTGTPPAAIPPPPAGLVHLTGRLQTAGDSINPAKQAARLGAPSYNAYLTLNADQPGSSGVSVLPDPDLSNPAGGAYEAQHFAYILQWYLFALLALAAPFVIGRSEVREARRRFLGLEPGADLGVEAGEDQNELPQLAAGAAAGGVIATRSNGAPARRGEPTAEQWQHATYLADRYGRSLGVGRAAPLGGAAGSGAPARRQSVEHNDRITTTAAGLHRSQDAYHGSYNDYLWQLAMAAGAAPEISMPPTPDPSRTDGASSGDEPPESGR